MNYVNICAVCWQPVDRPCIGRLSGKEMPVKHRAAHGPHTLLVTKAAAELMQLQLRKSVRELVNALPRRSDQNKVSVPKAVKTKADFDRMTGAQRNRKRGTDGYSPDSQKTGELTISQLVQLALHNPDVFKRRD